MEHFLIVEIHVFLIANYQRLNEHEYKVVDEKVLIDYWMLTEKNSSYQDDFDREYEMVYEPEKNLIRKKFMIGMKNSYG